MFEMDKESGKYKNKCNRCCGSCFGTDTKKWSECETKCISDVNNFVNCSSTCSHDDE